MCFTYGKVAKVVAKWKCSTGSCRVKFKIMQKLLILNFVSVERRFTKIDEILCYAFSKILMQPTSHPINLLSNKSG